MFREWLHRPVLHLIKVQIMTNAELTSALQAVADQLGALNTTIATKLAASGNSTPEEDAAVAAVKAAADQLTATVNA